MSQEFDPGLAEGTLLSRFRVSCFDPLENACEPLVMLFVVSAIDQDIVNLANDSV